MSPHKTKAFTQWFHLKKRSRTNLLLSWRWWWCRHQGETLTVYQPLRLRRLRLLPEEEHNTTLLLDHLRANLWLALLLCDWNTRTVGCIWSSSTSTSSSSSSSSSTAASGSSAMSSAESESAETWPARGRRHAVLYEWWWNNVYIALGSGKLCFKKGAFSQVAIFWLFSVSEMDNECLYLLIISTLLIFFFFCAYISSANANSHPQNTKGIYQYASISRYLVKNIDGFGQHHPTLHWLFV